MEKVEYTVSEDVAITDVKAFVDELSDEETDLNEVKEKYPKVVKAVMLGLLLLGDDLKYTLKEPVKNPAGEITISELSFKTRIVPTEQKKLQQGLNIKKDSFEFGLRCMGYIISQPVAILDKLGRFDYKLVEEISGLFL